MPQIGVRKNSSLIRFIETIWCEFPMEIQRIPRYNIEMVCCNFGGGAGTVWRSHIDEELLCIEEKLKN